MVAVSGRMCSFTLNTPTWTNYKMFATGFGRSACLATFVMQIKKSRLTETAKGLMRCFWCWQTRRCGVGFLVADHHKQSSGEIGECSYFEFHRVLEKTNCPSAHAFVLGELSQKDLIVTLTLDCHWHSSSATSDRSYRNYQAHKNRGAVNVRWFVDVFLLSCRLYPFRAF